MCDNLLYMITSHKQPLIMKPQTFPAQRLTVGTSHQQPPAVSDHDHFLGRTVLWFSFVLNLLVSDI